jgi:hypothetical protein
MDEGGSVDEESLSRGSVEEASEVGSPPLWTVGGM